MSALFLDRRTTITSKLREVSPGPFVPETSGPVYVLDESTDADSSSDDESDVFFEAEEELDALPCPRQAVHLPEEVLDEILSKLLEEADETSLRAASLVSKDWSVPSRRLLFSQTLPLTTSGSVKRLRHVLDARPELARAVKRVDLSNPGSAWQDGKAGETLRRAAGMLRCTPNVQEVSLLHVGLNDKTRNKFFGALRSLPIKTAYFYSSHGSYTRNGFIRPSSGGTADAEALVHLLCTWRHLESLTLSNYNSYPRILSNLVAPVHTFPSYRLADLSLHSVDLSNSTLLYLLGHSATTLKSLNLTACQGLSSSIFATVFELVGDNLENLFLNLDVDDLQPSAIAAPLDNALIRPLTKLVSFSLSTDAVFADSVLSELVTLPSLTSISLCFPTFDYDIVKRAIKSSASTKAAKTLVLDSWETNVLWDDAQRFAFLQVCEEEGVELQLNGLMKEDIEDEWYGEDVSSDWVTMEAPNMPRRGSRVRPIWR